MLAAERQRCLTWNCDWGRLLCSFHRETLSHKPHNTKLSLPTFPQSPLLSLSPIHTSSLSAQEGAGFATDPKP